MSREISEREQGGIAGTGEGEKNVMNEDLNHVSCRGLSTAFSKGIRSLENITNDRA